MTVKSNCIPSAGGVLTRRRQSRPGVKPASGCHFVSRTRQAIQPHAGSWRLVPPRLAAKWRQLGTRRNPRNARGPHRRGRALFLVVTEHLPALRGRSRLNTEFGGSTRESNPPGMGLPPRNGFEDRNRSSQPDPRCHVSASFVSRKCHPRPVLTRLDPGLVAKLGDKMATNAESLSI